MIPPTLILSANPIPGKAYRLRAIIGPAAPETLICQRPKERRRMVGASGFVYLSEYWWFLYPVTGELVEMEIEVN